MLDFSIFLGYTFCFKRTSQKNMVFITAKPIFAEDADSQLTVNMKVGKLIHHRLQSSIHRDIKEIQHK